MFAVALLLGASAGVGTGSGPIAERPACVVAIRGISWHASAANGTMDSTATCEKLADDTYAWVDDARRVAGSTVQTGDLGTGTASSSTYLRGDGTWATPAGGSEAFPVGSVFISVVSTNPGTLLGYGTWSAIGAGRVLVGIDAGDTDFDVVEETGGAKTHTLTVAQTPAHGHTQDAHGHTQDAHGHTQNSHTHALTELRDATTGGASTNIALTADTSSTLGTKASGGTVATNQNATATNQTTVGTNQNTGGGAAHPIVQPYLVCYFWKRTL